MIELCSICQNEDNEYYCQNTLNYCDFYVCRFAMMEVNVIIVMAPLFHLIIQTLKMNFSIEDHSSMIWF